MKSKILISRFALSTVLLSAVAFPSMSNADGADLNSTTTAEAPKLIAVSEVTAAPAAQERLITKAASTKGSVTVTTTARPAAQAAPVITSFTSPVELAEKYAPDTVEAWKSTLAQYDKLVQKHATTSVAAITSVSTIPAPVPSDAKLVETVEVTKPVEGAAVTETTKAVKITEAVKATKSTPAPTLQPVSIAIMDEADAAVTLNRIEAVEAQPATATLIAQKAGTVTIQSDDSDLSFVKAEIALAKAAQSKDSESVKTALSALMAQYKIQIAELEQAGK